MTNSKNPSDIKILFYSYFIVLVCFQCNASYAAPIRIENDTFPSFTVTTDQSAKKHIQKAQILIDLGEHYKSITYLNSISEKYKGHNKEIEARILAGLARNYKDLGLNHHAIEYWQKAIKMVESHEDSSYLVAVFINNMASSYINLGENEKAHSLLLNALEIFPLSETYNKLSKLVLDTNDDFVLSKSYLDNGLSHIENPLIPITSRFDSDVYFKKVHQANIIEGYAYYYYKKGDYETSLEKYKEALAISKEIKKVSLRVQILKDLGYVHKSLENIEQYNYYLSEFISLNDSLRVITDKTLGLILNDAIHSKKENTTAQETTIEPIRILFYFILFFVPVPCLFLFRNYKRHQKTIAIIKKSNIENQDLMNRLDESFNEIIHLAKINDPSFIIKFKQVHPTLYEKLTLLTPSLTDSELVLCAMVWLKFTSKEIAQFTFVQHKSVQIKKYRLRKKLALRTRKNLYNWLNNL